MIQRCRSAASSAGSGRTVVADGGFTLLETMMSIFVIGVMMTALTSFFVTTVSVVGQQSGVQVATQVAGSAVSKIRGMRGSALLTGLHQNTYNEQWGAVAAVAPAHLADLAKITDLPAGVSPVPLPPTVGATVPVNGVLYRTSIAVGRCWQAVTGGACGGSLASGPVPFFRVVLAVTWPERRCPGQACSYVTSTLVSSEPTEPLFNSNSGSGPVPQVVAPPQVGGANSPVNVQLTTTSGGQRPLSFSFSGLPTGVSGSSGGMLTGILPATSGLHTVSVVLRDASNTVVDTESFTWTVRSYPALVTGDSPWAYHRGDDAVSSTGTGTAADSSGHNRPGLYVGKTDGPSTFWKFDAGNGSTVADNSGAVNTGTVAGAGATWSTAGRSGGALSFDGTAGYVQAARPAVTTTSSFTVSAWVKLASGSFDHTIVSQDGTTVSGFYLQYRAGVNRWCMAMLTSDADAATANTACSLAPPTLNVWTQLTGVYDSAAGNIKLNVNGVLQATTPHSPSWSATGPLIVGGSKFSSERRDPVPGLIDEVRTYRRALSATEISTLYGDNPSLQYDFEESTGTTTADNSGNANTGTLASGVARTTAGHTGDAAQFSVDPLDYISSAAVPVNAAASFTLSTWVNLNTAGAVTRTVLSQQGVNHSTFILKYESSGKWAFVLTTGSAGVADQVLSSGNATFNSWVHLVAVHDTAAVAGAKMKLYVNNAAPVVGPHATGYGTTNPLQVGRTRWLSAWADPWDGEIDDVRTYRRALTAAEIAALYTSPFRFDVSPMTAGLPGALNGDQPSSTAVAFNGTSNAYGTQVPANTIGDFTTECWFRSTTTKGGQLIGFTQDMTGTASTPRDRMVYFDNANRLTFGIWWNNAARTVRSPVAPTYNDGTWHHLATSYGPAGLKLYVDGVKIAADPNYTPAVHPAGTWAGYWRWGGGSTAWPNGSGHYFTGTLDEVAVYHKQLTDADIAGHYQSGS